MNLENEPCLSSSEKGMKRRDFVKTAVAGSIGIQFLTHPVFGENAPMNRLKLAGIGVGSMGLSNLKNCSAEEIAVLCDVDTEYSKEAQTLFPEARFYRDFREMFAQENDLDGVVIATPDHTHAIIAMEAVRRGLNVYCQKPLCHSIHEARALTIAARKAGVVTQMGNQGRSFETMRLLKEWLDAGVIGNVTEIHAWTDRPVGGDPWSTFPITARPEEQPPVPAHFDWDLWLGPAQYRPYHPIYHPMTWRAFMDFGTGPLGDMGCHILDPSFYALELGSPTEVDASSSHWKEAEAAETYPRATRVRYQFPARGNKPPVTLNWTDGRIRPPRPKGFPNDAYFPTSGAFLIGDEGLIVHDSHGARGLKVYPDSLRASFMPNRPPRTIPRVKGSHEEDWIRGCKDRTHTPCSNFEYGGPLTEMVLLGTLAIRVPEQRLQWDQKNMTIPNHSGANALVSPPYREGWVL